MTRRSQSLQHSLSAAQWSEIDRLCDRYEDDWGPHRSSELAAWVQQASNDLRAAAAEELIALDRQLRSAAGCPAEPPSYAEALRLAVRPSSVAGEEASQTSAAVSHCSPNDARCLRKSLSTPTPAASDSAAEHSTRSTDGSVGSVSVNSRAGSRAAAIPAQIGRYRITAYLSGGGQGDVFRAIHPTLNREVVIKWGRNCFSDGAPEVEALLREGRILARLDHPNLVRVHDLDFHEGCPFLVLDFIPGRSVRQRCAAGEVAPAQAARWTAQAARALAEVHRHGLIHLDIKPENILIDDSGEAHVVDFGLAVMPELWAEQQAPLGCFRGTPAYASPEQARGAAQWADARADVFGLGALLYWLLTSRAPYQGDTIDEVLAQAAQCRFDRDALRGVPRPLAEIVLRAMSASPEDRHPSADALADDLDAWIVRQAAGGDKRRLFQTAGAFALAAAAVVALAASPMGQQAWRRWMGSSAIEPQARQTGIRPQPPPASQNNDCDGDNTAYASPNAADAADKSTGSPASAAASPAENSTPAASATGPSPTSGSRVAPVSTAESPTAASPTAQVPTVSSPTAPLPVLPGVGRSSPRPAAPSQTPDELPGGVASAEADRTPAESDGRPPLRWDRQTGALHWGDEVIRRVRVSQAGNIVRILDAFESQKWPKQVDQPLGEQTDRKTLFAACNSLNESLGRIRFRVAGDGVEWFVVDRAAPQ